MTPDDLAALLKWLYARDDGSGWLPAAARDLRLNERNLRGMLAGELAIPPAVAHIVCLTAASRTFLRGRGSPRPLLGEEAARIFDHWRHLVDASFRGWYPPIEA